jgi:hypothetical protein
MRFAGSSVCGAGVFLTLLGLLLRVVLVLSAFLSYAPMSLFRPVTVAVAAFLISLVFAHSAEITAAKPNEAATASRKLIRTRPLGTGACAFAFHDGDCVPLEDPCAERRFDGRP